MSVRFYSDIGENAMIIVKALLANQRLMRLIYYTDKDPLANDAQHPDVSDTIIQEEIFGKRLKIVPRVATNETANPTVVIKFDRFVPNEENIEFKDVKINIEVMIPISSWIVRDTNLRPFLLMGEIEKSLKGKKINGLGKIESAGAQLNFLTDEISDYEMTFWITSYD